MTLELVQINDVIKDAVDIFSQQLKVRGISLTSETDPDVPKIPADPNRLEQVFINLLVNARDAIEEKWTAPGPIKNDNRITITTRVTNASITASVRDTGAGIPSDILNKIFDPFFTTKAVGKGTGLGLSISYGIVKECGGEITARSSAAGGACFTLSFPKPGDRGNARSLP
jgi:histidine kinase